MDRKEAVLRIKNHMEHHGIGKYPHLKLKEALDMAIAALSPPNEPLTLEQLREMKGQPVWTVTTGIKGSGRWELVCNVDYEDVLEMESCVDGFYYIEVNTYGSTWNAYRRPPEGEEGDADRG